MGNCCLKGRSRLVWADDDENDQWVYYSDPNLEHKESLLADEKVKNHSKSPSVSINGNSSSNNNGKTREVKIKLSKKKLEELLGKVENLHDIPMDQLLDRLIDSSEQFDIHDCDDHYHHQHAWKPNLSSIPEENF
uniref:uncharacterized protein LOC122597035 n=1 Tax=Erigeron canadensis TaxID=72917 RepID=UPI001CB8AC81|nr:uncharacterized protein LOC122597035 [Erigeron canadensis]